MLRNLDTGPTVKQFSLFLVTGGFSLVVNMASRYLLNFYVSFELAVALAYLVGMAVAFTLARCFVFQASERSILSEFYRFSVVNAFALVLVWCVSVGLARVFFPSIGFDWHPETVAHFIGLSTTAVTSYVGHRFYTFSNVTYSKDKN